MPLPLPLEGLSAIVTGAGLGRAEALELARLGAAVVERPRVAATFDTAEEAFGHEELDGLLTPYFAERPPIRPSRRRRSWD